MKPATFPSFVATGQDVSDVGAAIQECSLHFPGRVYGGVAWMEPHGDLWLVTIGNDSRILPLPDAEAMLWEWYRGEYLAFPSPEAVAEDARPHYRPPLSSPYLEALEAFERLHGCFPSECENYSEAYAVVEAAEAILAR